ncbi:MAG: hypothetical protein WB973_10565 [Thermoanaerobaculia bacterium]
MSVARGCGNDPQPGSEFYQAATVPVLTRLTLPDSSSYSFTYQTDSTACAQGAITSLQFPTGGTRKYQYHEYGIPGTTCDSYLVATPRLESKSDFKAGETTSAAATWTYATSYNGTVQVDALCPDSSRPLQKEFLSEELQVAATSPEGHKSVHYFSIWPTELRDNPNGFSAWNYGYPLTSFSGKKNGTRYLSTEEYQYECLTTCGQVLKRSSYLLYEGLDPGPDSPRATGSRTVFHDDGDKYVDTDSSDYDGYGHLRMSVTSSNFEGTAPRTVTTRYNSLSAANGRAAGQPGLLIGRNSPWILDKYDRVTTAQGTDVSVVDACFDPTGFMTGRRTYKNTGTTITASTNDVVTTYTKRTSSPNFGFVADEHWFGGDLHPLSSSYSDLCTLPGSTQDYEMDYTYDSGVLKTSKYAAMNWLASDRDIDSHTGLVYASRDSSGVETTLTYDTSGRLKTVRPAGRAWTDYTYNIAAGISSPTTFTPASFVAKQCLLGAETCTSPLTEGRTYFDDFGRVVQSKNQMPDGWSTVNSGYDALGRVISTSMPEYTATGDYQQAFAPAHVATTTYDAFDRPLKLTSADGKETTFTYTGTSKIDRTSTIATSTSTAETTSTTTETYDGLGRLYSVIEPGTNSTTTYANDIGGRLRSVSMVAGGVTQGRSFLYDGRGFLQSEQHPELGVNGNGTTTYGGYDARGHAHNKLSGPAGGTYDLSFTYDPAERLTGVSDAGGSHPVKSFTFGDLNGTDSPIDYRKGKLLTAVRYNAMPSPVSGDVAVTETYKYKNDAGLPSERDTEVKKDSTTLQSFSELFSYDSLGAVKEPGYPTCLSPCSVPAAPTTNTYTNGFLTSVTGFGSLAYNSNGTLGSVLHSNTVTDTIAPDDTGMPRPKSIAYSGWTTPACSGPSTPTVTAQSARLGTNNQGTTMTASTTACSGVLTYQWYRGNSGDTSAPLGTGSSYATGPLQTTTSFWVRVTDSTTNSASSPTTVITICDPAAITTQPQSTTLEVTNQGVALSVVVNGCGTISYQWYRGNSGDTSTPLQGTAATYATGSLTSTTSFWVKVTDSTGPTTVNSTTAVITVNTNTLCTPQVTEPPQNQTINAPGEALLHVAVTGCTGRNFFWYEGPEGNKFASQNLGSGTVGNGTSTLHGYYPWKTVSVWVEIYGDTLNTVTRAATITVVSPVPTGLNAYVTPGQTGPLTSITVTWQSTGADHYQLQRCLSGCTPFTAASPFVDGGRTPNTTYVYQVRSVDSSGNGMSNWSVADLTTTMRFTPLQSLSTTVQFAHLTELLNGLNAVLAASGPTQLSWQNIHDRYVPSHPTELFPLPAANGPICAAHLKALRSEMTAARQALGVAAFPYTDALTTTPATPVKAIHFRDLQDSSQ